MRKNDLLGYSAIATAGASVIFGLAASFSLVTKLVVIAPVSAASNFIIFFSAASLIAGTIIAYRQILVKQAAKSSDEVRKYPIRITFEVDGVVVKMEFPTEGEVNNVLSLLKRLSVHNLSISGEGTLHPSTLAEYKTSLVLLGSEERFKKELRHIGYARYISLDQGRGVWSSSTRHQKKKSFSDAEKYTQKDKVDDKV